MKRIVLALLAIIMTFTAASCSNGANDNDSVTTTGKTDAPKNDLFVSWMNAGYYKNTQKAEAPDDILTEYDMFMAKNESETAQISVRGFENVRNVSFSFEGALPEGIKGELFEIKTVSIEGDRWPDGLVPIDENKTLDIKKDKTFSVLIKLTSENDTPAGKSDVTVVMKDSEGKELGRYTIKLTVWDIVIPEAPAITTWVPLDKESIAKQYGLGDIRVEVLDSEKQAELDRLYKQYYDYLLEFGVTGGELPYDILDDHADAYMSDPRVTSFTVAAGEFDADKVKAIYEKVKTNPVWLEKAIYYVLDEPTTSEMLDELKARADAFRAIAPEIKITSAYYTNVRHSSGVDITTFLQDNIDIPTPKLCLFEQFGGIDAYKSRFEQFREDGNKLWTYVCWEPGKPYVNLYVNEQGIDHRIMFIQVYDIGADGWLYWCANKWYDIEAGVSPWNSMATIPWMTYDVYGDGCVMYPGNDVGVEGPCASLRLEAIRDGVEDIALLKLAEDVLGKAATDKLVDKVTMTITMYATNESTFNAFRAELGSAVEAALKKA